MEKEANLKARYIILDTNILIKIGENADKADGAGKKILEHLSHILGENPGWFCAISLITAFELTDQSTFEKEVARERQLSDIKKFNVSIKVIRLAGRLGCFYKECNIAPNQIEGPDKIIAATAVVTGSIIFTTNPSDYPAPFFKEVLNYRKVIEHTGKSGYPVFTPVYLFSPEPQIIGKYWDRRVGPYRDKVNRESKKEEGVI